MLKQIRHQLLKLPRVQAAVAGYKHRQEEQHYHEHWKMLIKSSGMVK